MTKTPIPIESTRDGHPSDIDRIRAENDSEWKLTVRALRARDLLSLRSSIVARIKRDRDRLEFVQELLNASSRMNGTR